MHMSKDARLSPRAHETAQDRPDLIASIMQAFRALHRIAWSALWAEERRLSPAKIANMGKRGLHNHRHAPTCERVRFPSFPCSPSSPSAPPSTYRKSVVQGKCVSIHVELGVRRII